MLKHFFYLVLSITTAIFLLGACKPMQQEPQKDNLPETVSISLPESAQHFSQRFVENYQGAPADAEFFNVNVHPVYFNSEKTVLFEHGKHTFKLPYVGMINAYEDSGHKPFLGISDYVIYADLGKASNISDEEARQNFYRLVKQMHQAGWRDLIYRSEPRIKRNRKNAAAFFEIEDGWLNEKWTSGIPTTIELTAEEWKKLPHRARLGDLYADGVIVSFSLGKDDSDQYRDKYGNGQYALVVTIEAYWNRVRLIATEEFGKPTYNDALNKQFKSYAIYRKMEEDKARAQGFEIDESYQDPPIPPLIELPRDGSR
ncbi:hypothetical protein LVJ85_07390 [Neisseria sp. Dent CA1/247]|uniref:hypothetical protein n=1 Tax=Neisseria sp. Dent CA1/247 TaxID=2912675 RepID=UPI001FD1B9B8|nr:hypothetical protein [Neisseria sp. Dent CA1/247]UOO75879.1 hypothetical protein LVJ85_07390 [Neisseria sp. Dent CA1/247]